MTPEQEKIVASLSGLAAYEIEQLVNLIVSTREIYGPQDYEQLLEDFDRLLEENVSLERSIRYLEDDLRDYEDEVSKLQRRVDSLMEELENRGETV